MFCLKETKDSQAGDYSDPFLQVIYEEHIAPQVRGYTLDFGAVSNRVGKTYIPTFIQAFSSAFSSNPSKDGPGVYVLVKAVDSKEFFTVAMHFDEEGSLYDAQILISYTSEDALVEYVDAIMFLHYETSNYDTAVLASTDAITYHLNGSWTTAWEKPQSFFVIEANQCAAAFLLAAGMETSTDLHPSSVPFTSGTTTEWAADKYQLQVSTELSVQNAPGILPFGHKQS